MHEILEEVIAHLRGMWRYKWVSLLMAWIVCLLGWAYVTKMPDQYRTTAQVMVDSASVLKPLMQGLAVEPNVSQRAQMISRTLLTRPTLEQVAKAVDPGLLASGGRELEAAAFRLQNNLSIQGTDRLLNLYTVQYQSRDPNEAFEVVRVLVELFTEGFRGGSREDSEMARRFLDGQIREYEERLQAAEQRLADFRRANAGLLPDDRGGYDQRLQHLSSQLAQTELELREAVNRRNELQRQLAGTGRAAVASRFDSRIAATQARLDELSQQFTERHPDIVSLRQTLAELRAQRDEEQRRIQGGGPIDGALLENPLYQGITLALSNTQMQVSTLTVRADEFRQRIAALEELVDTIPQVEAELARLDRDYEVNRQNFVELLQRRERAAITGTLDAGSDQVQFRVVEPPRVPVRPSEPNRPLLNAGVLVFGLASGAGLAFLLSWLNPVFDHRRALSAATGLPVLGTIALAPSSSRNSSERREIYLFVVVVAALLSVFVVVVLVGRPLAQLVRGLLGSL